MYCVYLVNGDLRMRWKAFKTLQQAQSEQKKLSLFHRKSIIQQIIK